MLVIDTHTHAGLNWFQPVESLLTEMDRNGVAGAVLVQHGGSFDNAYLLECATRFPGRFRIVVQIGPVDTRPEATLAGLRARGAAGVRLDARSPIALWTLAGELGMVVSAGGRDELFGDDFKRLLDRCPGTTVQLEHLAGLGLHADSRLYERALECARWPNTSIKVPGVGEIVERPGRLPVGYPFGPTPPYFELALASFGIRRMTWGSDFPVCAGREGYANCLRGVREHSAFGAADDADWVMGRSAAAIWGFDAAQTVDTVLNGR